MSYIGKQKNHNESYLYEKALRCLRVWDTQDQTTMTRLHVDSFSSVSVSHSYKKHSYRGIARRTSQYRKKLAIDEWPWHTPKVITDAAIKWPYGTITYCLSTVVSTSLSRTVFKTLPLLKWTWLPVTLKTPSFLTTKLKLQATCTF